MGNAGEQPRKGYAMSAASNARMALDAQNACNGVAVINHLARMSIEIFRDEVTGTDAHLRHPVIVAMVDKLRDLVEGAAQKPLEDAASEAFSELWKITNSD